MSNLEIDPCLRLEQGKVVQWLLVSDIRQNRVAEDGIIRKNGHNQAKHGVLSIHGLHDEDDTVFLNRHGG